LADIQLIDCSARVSVISTQWHADHWNDFTQEALQLYDCEFYFAGEIQARGYGLKNVKLLPIRPEKVQRYNFFCVWSFVVG